MVYVFSKAGAYYNRVDISGNFKGWEAKSNAEKKSPVYSSGMPNGWKDIGNDGTKRCALSVINNSTSHTRGGHPTEKPEELYKFLIERYCPVGGTVLDPTFGSCNSGRATETLNRNYIGIEKDETFYKKAVKSLIGEE
jgi:site-specific DNA-methyltransferase (adenine-specific)